MSPDSFLFSRAKPSVSWMIGTERSDISVLYGSFRLMDGMLPIHSASLPTDPSVGKEAELLILGLRNLLRPGLRPNN